MPIDEATRRAEPAAMDWQLTSSNSRVLAGIQLLSWLLLAGPITLVLAVAGMLAGRGHR